MKFERRISIARPPAEVFSYIADVRNDPSWHTDVLEVRSSTDVVGMGTVFKVKVKPSMGVSEGTMTVTNICEPEAQGSRVTRRVKIEPSGIMRLMAPLI